MTISHLSVAGVEMVRDRLVEMSRLLRGSEPPERWFRRVNEPSLNGEVAADLSDPPTIEPAINPTPLPQEGFRPPEQQLEGEDAQ